MGSYPFLFQHKIYLLKTVPGSARAGVFCPREKRYLGFYDPADSPDAQGQWVKTDGITALEAFTPQVQQLCDYRRRVVFGGETQRYPFA